MALHFEKVTRDFADMQKLKELNKEAFPKEEREDVDLFVEYTEDGYSDFWAIYDDETFVGFVLLARKPPIAYIGFFAIDSKIRSKGYGSRSLDLLKTLYPDYQLVLDIERIDELHDNTLQRKSRKEFYLRNGFQESGYNLTYNGLVFEILFFGDTFDKETYLAMMEEMRDEEFKPKLLEK